MMNIAANVLNFYYEVLGSKRKLFGPQKFRWWTHTFLVLCVVALSLDPLFCYILVLNEDNKCLRLDRTLGTVAIASRSIIDFFYILHIIFQFSSRIASLSSEVWEIRAEIGEITWRYFLFYSLVDILVVLPIPQVLIITIVPKLNDSRFFTATKSLNFIVIFQYVLRVTRITYLLKKVTSTSRILAETAWANLFLYLLASHVVGAFWYLFAVERKIACWQEACNNNAAYCSLYCDNNFGPRTFMNDSCSANSTHFDFGIYIDALGSGVVYSADFVQKISYCFWWGLQNLSSLGQGLKTSTYVWEIYFAALVSISGLVLLSSLIGNMQTYLQLETARLADKRAKEQEREYCMAFYTLPNHLRMRIKKHRWREDIRATLENFFLSLPRDLRRETKQHICLGVLMRVPMFEKMDEQLLDAMCDRLEPVLYTEDSYIVREGDPVDEMLFIMRGKLLTMTTNGGRGGRTGFFNSVYLKAGDFCGEELLTWALVPHTNLPISTRTVQALSEVVEAFALKADDLKFVGSQFRCHHGNQLRHTFRFYSQQWRTWAACFIQAAWCRYSKKKLEESLREEENRLQDALAKAETSSPSLGDTIYASRLAANVLRAVRLRRSGTRKGRVPERIPPMLLQKPAEPDFTAEEQ